MPWSSTGITDGYSGPNYLSALYNPKGHSLAGLLLRTPPEDPSKSVFRAQALDCLLVLLNWVTHPFSGC